MAGGDDIRTAEGDLVQYVEGSQLERQADAFGEEDRLLQIRVERAEPAFEDIGQETGAGEAGRCGLGGESLGIQGDGEERE